MVWFNKIVKTWKKYVPDQIFCLVSCLKDYKLKYKNTKVSIINFEKKKKNFDFINCIKIKKKAKRILILSGLHDVKDLYLYAKYTLNFDEKDIFYFKLHPKNKFNFIPGPKIKKIDNFKKKTFSRVIVSQTSSLSFDFLSLKRNFSVIDLDYKQNYEKVTESQIREFLNVK